MEEMFFMWVVM